MVLSDFNGVGVGFGICPFAIVFSTSLFVSIFVIFLISLLSISKNFLGFGVGCGFGVGWGFGGSFSLSFSGFFFFFLQILLSLDGNTS